MVCGKRNENEVMFRSEDDYIRGFNCYAVALARIGSVYLPDERTKFRIADNL